MNAAGKTVFISTPPAAFDLASGKQLWQASVPEWGQGGPALSRAGDLLFVGLYDPVRESGSIAAIATADGSVRWRAVLDRTMLAFFDHPWVNGDVVIVPGFTGTIMALDVASGTQRWAYQPPGERFGTVTVATTPSGNALVWLALQNGEVLALDAATGAQVARLSDITLNLGDYSFAQRAVPIGQQVLIPLGNRLIALKPPTR
ncbi:MAG: PQQ-like beta-propeller repeat protein [Chloroflexi bacterium]|nr:PQQ-like beta-propeller repeat protein [Chloroflexota bacterium]